MVYNSRAVKPSDCFCRAGTQSDGHDFIRPGKGAAAIGLRADARDSGGGVACSRRRLGRTMADMAAAFYDYPSRGLKLVGITGTNGKTDRDAALISTCGRWVTRQADLDGSLQDRRT